MPNPTFDRFVQVPGAARGYTKGRNRMVNCVEHFTVGRYGGDYAIGMQGYFQCYIPREMSSVQFAEIDAVCWHAGSWNGDGCGVEFERLSWDEPLTDKQINDGGALIDWLHNEWGIPLDFYDGPRVPAWQGFINHGSLLGRGETQDHTDGITRDEWNLMTGVDLTPEQAKMLEEVHGILTGGGVYPSLEARIETNVNAHTDAAVASIPSGGRVPLKVTLSGTATPA